MKRGHFSTITWKGILYWLVQILPVMDLIINMSLISQILSERKITSTVNFSLGLIVSGIISGTIDIP